MINLSYTQGILRGAIKRKKKSCSLWGKQKQGISFIQGDRGVNCAAKKNRKKISIYMGR